MMARSQLPSQNEIDFIMFKQVNGYDCGQMTTLLLFNGLLQLASKLMLFGLFW